MLEQANNSWINSREFETEWGGRTLKVKTGVVAQQASGSALVQYGETVVLVTATQGNEQSDRGYFPLMVDYEEKLYAAGIIKGSRFIKRETRPTDEAVLTARLVDRAIRPFFDDSTRLDTQIIVTVLSVDGENDADIPGMIGASVALMISDINWDGPVVGARVGFSDGKYILNPTYAELETSELDMFVAGDGESTIMLEAGAKEVKEDDVFAGIEFGLSHMKPVMDLMAKVQAEVGVEKKVLKVEELTEEEQVALKEIEEHKVFIKGLVEKEIGQYFEPGANTSKKLRKESMKALKTQMDEALKEKQVGKDKRKAILSPLKDMVEEYIGEMVLKTGKRVDGRSATEVRPLDVAVGILPRTHGTGLFTRGETQVLTVATLAGPGAAQTLEGIDENGEKSYMHHYNFPGFSVGEVKPLRGPSRRDIGHGALAEKALVPVIPAKEDFPYTIRLVSEVLGSNGSSSMASACGSTLALMHAGVPIKNPVSGLAMGLVSNDKGDWVVLTDLQDLEDGQGGMDFKVTGTKDGITAIQLDTKTHGLASEILKTTLHQSKDGRKDILDAMLAVIPAPGEMSAHAPRVETIEINPEKIRDLIGPGGKMINSIIDETGVEIDIEQDGKVFVSSVDAAGMDAAKARINAITEEPEVGKTYHGKVARLMDFGAFVEILPGKDGLVHVSEIAHERVENVSDRLKEGQEVDVKLMEIDSQGRLNLSMKALIEKPAGMSDDRGGSRGGGNRSGGNRGGGNNRGGNNRGGSSRPQQRRSNEAPKAQAPKPYVVSTPSEDSEEPKKKRGFFGRKK